MNISITKLSPRLLNEVYLPYELSRKLHFHAPIGTIVLSSVSISSNNWLFHNQEEKEAAAAASQKSQDKPDESVS